MKPPNGDLAREEPALGEEDEGVLPPEGVHAGREDGVLPPEGVQDGREDGEGRGAPDDPVGRLNPPEPFLFFFFPGGGCWLP